MSYPKKADILNYSIEDIYDMLLSAGVVLKHGEVTDFSEYLDFADAAGKNVYGLFMRIFDNEGDILWIKLCEWFDDRAFATNPKHLPRGRRTESVEYP